jgi:hypothetical protein
MNKSSFASLLLSLAVALASLGYTTPAFAGKDKNCDPPDPHPSCKPDSEPPGEPPALPVCADTCIASVGKWHPAPAQDYASLIGGSYTEISHGEFGDILSSLPENEYDDLCDAYDVLIFEWNSPNIKHLDWWSLVNYMACGGGILFEDPTNVDAITDGVTTSEILVHDKTGLFGTIAFDSDCVPDGSQPTSLCSGVPYPNVDSTFDINNNHMVFADIQPDPNASMVQLVPFLRLPSVDNSGVVLGLYGEFVHGGEVIGKIILTGPDNNFHGDAETTNTDPNDDAHKNQYDLLFDELNWLLDETLPPPIELP